MNKVSGYCSCAIIEKDIGVEKTINFVDRTHTSQELMEVSNAIPLKLDRLIKAQERIQQPFFDLLGNLGKLNLREIIESTREHRKIAQAFDYLTGEVVRNWSNFSVEEKEALTDIAYELVERYYTDKKEGRWQIFAKIILSNPLMFSLALVNAVALVIKYREDMIKVSSDYKEAKAYLNQARYNFVDNILSAVERDDSRYQQALSNSLDEIKKLKES